MTPIFRSWFRTRRPRIPRRPDATADAATARPLSSDRLITHDVSRRDRAVAHGGIGAVHLLARRLGRPQAADERLHPLKVPPPYHASDHALDVAYSAFGHGTGLPDIDRRRNDDALRAARAAGRRPDPPAAGDFGRRFTRAHLDARHHAIDAARRKAWAGQPASFFDRPALAGDGTRVGTTAACKAGVDGAGDGTRGHRPLAVGSADTGEASRRLDRSGRRPSPEGAAGRAGGALGRCRPAGFRRTVPRGDTDFSRAHHRGRGHPRPGVHAVVGCDARPNLRDLAGARPGAAWEPPNRPARYPAKTRPRTRPESVADRVVRAPGFDILRPKCEQAAAFAYRPTARTNTYRMVVIRKNVSAEKGEPVPFPDVRYSFALTNDRAAAPAGVASGANDRCGPENVPARRRGGVRSLHAPVNTPEGNGAWMVVTAPAWNLRARWARLLPVPPGRRPEQHRDEKHRVLRLEFEAFASTFVTIPCRVARTGRRLVPRVLGWTPSRTTFFRRASGVRP